MGFCYLWKSAGGEAVGESSVESGIQFISYKVDSFSFQMAKDLSILSRNDFLSGDWNWNYNLSVGIPTFFKDQSAYVCSVGCVGSLTKRSDNQQVLTFLLNLAGIFRASGGKLEVAVEESLIKYQVPAILLPYLRGVITTFLSTAGYGGVIFPLVNMNQVAEQALKDSTIQIVENTKKQQE